MIGIGPIVLRRNGSTVERMNGASTNKPHKPKPTLGIATSSSMMNERMLPSVLGAYSEMNSAPPTANGVASSSARIDVTIVPKM